MRWTLIEPCAGGCALTLHLIGAPRALVPYQGSKWSVRREIEAVIRARGFEGPPGDVVLTDVSPIAESVGRVLTNRRYVLPFLRQLVYDGEMDPISTFERLQGATVPPNPDQRAAECLWLQRMAYVSKAVGVRDRRWVSPGYSRSAAEGVAATDRFGEVKPLGSSLLSAVLALPVGAMIDASIAPAVTPARYPSIAPPFKRWVVYIDPPYQGTTPYPSGHLSRHEVVDLALQWQQRGATVIVSEAEPIAELFGWETINLRGSSRSPTRQAFRRQGEEWVTVSPRPRV